MSKIQDIKDIYNLKKTKHGGTRKSPAHIASESVYNNRPIPERIADFNGTTVVYNDLAESVEATMAQAGRCNCNQNLCQGGCGVKRPVGEAMKAFAQGSEGGGVYVNEKLDELLQGKEINSLTSGEAKQVQKELKESFPPEVFDGFRRAYNAMTSTSIFLITGKLCPEMAPCMKACTQRGDDAVQIRDVEATIEKIGQLMGWFDKKFQKPEIETGKKVLVVGDGPGGMQTAYELRLAGHDVTVITKNERIGGLITNGIPDFKYPKDKLDPYINGMKNMGVKFETSIEAGKGNYTEEKMEQNFDAVVWATGVTNNPRMIGAKVTRLIEISERDEEAGKPVHRDWKTEPTELTEKDIKGYVFAMDYLTAQNDAVDASKTSLKPHISEVDLSNKKIIVGGAGDTASDCIGTAVRQKFQAQVKNPNENNYIVRFDRNLLQKSNEKLDAKLRKYTKPASFSEEELMKFDGDSTLYSTNVEEFVVNKNNQLVGVVYEQRALKPGFEIMEGVDNKLYDYNKCSEVTKRGLMTADTYVNALGYLGPNKEMLSKFGIEFNGDNIDVKNNLTNKISNFVAGDIDPYTNSGGRSWLVVHALQSGLNCASQVNKFLSQQVVVDSGEKENGAEAWKNLRESKPIIKDRLDEIYHVKQAGMLNR